MILSDATNKNGLIQECEFWTNLGDAAISGNSTLLKVFVNRLNRADDKVLPLVFSVDDTMRWDDPNQVDYPMALTNIVSGQQDYSAIQDEVGNSILNVVSAFVLQSATATEYIELQRVPVGAGHANRILNPAPTYVGIPTEYVERGSALFLGAVPNYNATNGLKIFFERSPSYFSASTLTARPGIPEPFHPLLALHASKDYIAVHKPDNGILIGELKQEIARQEAKLEQQNAARHPRRKRISGSQRCAV
jgi:hypothetical protein